MPALYDTTQPRVSISRVDVDSCAVQERELGQASTMGEAMFFLSLGYSVHIAEWDGMRYVPRCNYLPEDLQ
jgi:hypothetical protein